jgi:dimethylargininase
LAEKRSVCVYLVSVYSIEMKEKMNKKFTNAIVRKPCPEMVNGLTTAGLGKPDYEKALEQHSRYIDILSECGLAVNVLDSESEFPDSTFIEDVALCTLKCAIITNPGAPSRNGEKHGIKPVLQKYYDSIEEITDPGTLDAGDVMMVGNHFYIGISGRTNHAGADQLIHILQKYDMTGTKVPLKEMLHLKTGLSYLEQNTLLISGEFVHNPEFEKYSAIFVDENELYAANSLWINGTVLVPKGFNSTKSKIERAGYKTIEIDVSEFRKLDGGLSCLSLRF